MTIIKDLIKVRLNEAFKSSHWKDESYPTRIERSTFNELGEEPKREVDKRISDIENIEFSRHPQQKLGVWIYDAEKEVKHPPFKLKDKGIHLLGIINNNNMTTLYWKHIKEGRFDYSITYEELMEIVNSEFYNPKTNPISIGNIIKFQKSKIVKIPTKPKLDKFIKIKLSNNNIIKYFPLLNIFKTLNDTDIELDNIFDDLPEDIQKKIYNLLENKR